MLVSKKTSIIIVGIFLILVGILSSIVIKPKVIQLHATTLLGDQAKPLPAFQLIDHNGNPFNKESMMGKWNLLFFGYTNCPDICPNTLQLLADTMDQIKDENVRNNLQIAFISVDPDRDELTKMKSYVTYFNDEFLSAKAEIDKINVLTEAIGILHYTVKSSDEEVYDVAHSAALTLIDPDGNFTGVLSTPHDSGKIAHDLTALIDG